jgi:hypothetical protein
MGAHLDLVSHPIDSAAVDFLQLTYKPNNDDRLDEIFATIDSLADHLRPDERWSAPVPAKHFTHCQRHPAGVQFSYTPMQSAAGGFNGAKNPGAISVEISGRFLASYNAKARQTLYLLLDGLPNLFRCNRLDAQITVLRPQVDALALLGMVERNEVWPVGFGRTQAYCERLWGGATVGAVTTYWGGRESRIRARDYDKAKEQGWSVPAVRHETQSRREVAAQLWVQLVRACEPEAFTGDLLVTAEERFVRNVVGSQLDFRDTTAWANGDRPKNWAQFAPVPKWWQDTVAQPVLPYEIQYRKPADLDASYEAAISQYGRKLAMEFLRRSLVEGTAYCEQAMQFGLRAAGRLRREDMTTLFALLPEEHHEALREQFTELANDGSKSEEGTVNAFGTAPAC